jgi:hypothetical protein
MNIFNDQIHQCQHQDFAMHQQQHAYFGHQFQNRKQIVDSTNRRIRIGGGAGGVKFGRNNALWFCASRISSAVVLLVAVINGSNDLPVGMASVMRFIYR